MNKQYLLLLSLFYTTTLLPAEAGNNFGHLPQEQKNRLLLECAQKEDTQNALKLIEANADIYSADDSGFQAIHIATVSANLDLLKQLTLQDPTLIYATTNDESQPIHIVIAKPNIEIVLHILAVERQTLLTKEPLNSPLKKQIATFSKLPPEIATIVTSYAQEKATSLEKQRYLPTPTYEATTNEGQTALQLAAIWYEFCNDKTKKEALTKIISALQQQRDTLFAPSAFTQLPQGK